MSLFLKQIPIFWKKSIKAKKLKKNNKNQKKRKNKFYNNKIVIIKGKNEISIVL